MPDIATIGAALSSLKAATDIVAFLRQSDLSLERAELKFKLAELIGALADTKIELINVQETLAQKDKQIEELEAAFQSKDTLIRHYDAYYHLSEKGDPTGAPFCARCWENEHNLRQLIRDDKSPFNRICSSCGHKYHGRYAFDIQVPQDEKNP